MTLAPLYLFDSPDEHQQASLTQGPESNFVPAFVAQLTAAFEGAIEPTPAPEEIFNYLYGIVQSRVYRQRYGAAMKVDFPRVPLARSPDLFAQVGELGKRFLEIHLDEGVAPSLGKFVGSTATPVGRSAWSDGTIWIDAPGRAGGAGTAGFTDVPEGVWDFQFGGYQPCHKWLKDRKGRSLSSADMEQYTSMLGALSETAELADAVDIAVEAFGGWPGAFVGA